MKVTILILLVEALAKDVSGAFMDDVGGIGSQYSEHIIAVSVKIVAAGGAEDDGRNSPVDPPTSNLGGRIPPIDPYLT